MGVSTYTMTDVVRTVFGNKRVVVVKFAITAIGTDGVPVDAATLGMAAVDFVLPFLDVACDVAGGAVCALWDPTNSALQFLSAADTLCSAGALVVTAYALAVGS